MPVRTGVSTYTGEKVTYWEPYFSPSMLGGSPVTAWIPGVLNLIYYTLLLLWITFYDTPRRLITGKKMPIKNWVLLVVEIILLVLYIYGIMSGTLKNSAL